MKWILVLMLLAGCDAQNSEHPTVCPLSGGETQQCTSDCWSYSSREHCRLPDETIKLCLDEHPIDLSWDSDPPRCFEHDN